MRQRQKTHSRRIRLALSLIVAVGAVAGGLLLTTLTSQASPPHVSARAASADAACQSYVTQATASENSSADSATIIDAYPTTAGNLAAWLLNFNPMGPPQSVTGLSPSSNVSACVLQGSWVLPANGGKSSGNAGYEIVMVTSNGVSTPLMWGQSVMATATPPAVGS